MKYDLALAESILKENTDVSGWLLTKDGTFLVVLQDGVEVHGRLPKSATLYSTVLNNSVSSAIKAEELRAWRDSHGR